MVCVLVYVLKTAVSRAETADLIEMPSYEHCINHIHKQTLFILMFQSLSETIRRNCSVLLPVLATVVM